MKKSKEDQALVKTTGFAVIELEDELLQDVTGGIELNVSCPRNSGNCVSGCGC